jgi:hypothetical protein
MINLHETIKASLSTILPTHYEMVLHSGLATPCISYMELTNIDDATGDTVGYSRIQYQVKVWGDRVLDLQRYALEIDRVMRALGFKRVSSTELYDNNSSMMQKVLGYEALGLENFN